MRIASLLLLLLAGQLGTAAAQITLTEADVRARLSYDGPVSEYETVNATGLQTLADRVGGNQTWDFTGLTFTPVLTTQVSPATLPVPGSNDPHLAQATNVIAFTRLDSTAYAFYRISNSKAELLGISGETTIEEEDVLFQFNFEPAQLELPIPLTASSTWGSTYQYQLVPDSLGLFGSWIEETSAVEGWGTLVTPSGSAPALKVRTKTVSVDTFALPIPGVPPIITRDSSYTVIFYTKTGLSASILLDGDGMATDAFLSDFDETGTADEPGPGRANRLNLRVEGANPVRRGQSVTVAYDAATPGDARVEVYDLLGRSVAVAQAGTVAAGTQRATWSTGNLPAGLYIVRATVGGRSATTRLIVTN